MSQQELEQHHMRRINVDKVVINVGVGRSGEPVEKAKNALLELTSQRPAVRGAKKTVRDFGIHKGEPIGVVVTLRRQPAIEFLKRVIAAKRNVLKASSFDDYGNISLGIHEHIDIPGTKYNPDIGIFGMDVNVVLSRPGYRIARKSRRSTKIGKTHRINKDEAVDFFKQEYGVEVE
ncbi:MAG: 50S ribosomal protein L5 [Thermoproteota archaeon]|nr:50S ribosomal protein L5 [Thermoproteota archaeon]